MVILNVEIDEGDSLRQMKDLIIEIIVNFEFNMQHLKFKIIALYSVV